ncbi:MAG: ribosome silencing factor [Burkholderiales bacterium]|nr:ribosome silencing factor [Opitutaceae bacterium]
MATDTAPDIQTTALLRTLITALEDKKADDLKVLHVGGLSDITDYLVLATGNSEPHLRALRIEAEKVLDAAKVKIAGMDQGGFNSGWTVVDAYQIMVHFFTAEQRGNYALEKLWKDAAEVDLKTMATKPAPVAKVAKPKSGKAPKATAKVKAKAPAVKSSKAKKPASKTPASKIPAPKKPLDSKGVSAVKKLAGKKPVKPTAKKK